MPSIPPPPPDVVGEPRPGPEGAPGAVRWGLGDVAAGWALGLLATFAATFAVVVLTGNLDRAEAWADEMSILWFAVIQLPLEVVLLGWPLLITHTKGNGVVADLGLDVRLADAPMGLAIGFGTQIVLLPLLYWPLLHLLGDPDVSAAARELTDRADGSALGAVVLVVVVALLAPVAEEVFYRGLLLRALEHRFGMVAAVWGSSLLFGLAHLQPLQLLGQATFGLIAALLVQRHERLGPAIFAHIGFNATAVVSLLALS